MSSVQERYYLINLRIDDQENTNDIAVNYLKSLEKNLKCKRIVFFYKQRQEDYDVLVVAFTSTIARLSNMFEFFEDFAVSLQLDSIPVQIDKDKYWIVYNYTRVRFEDQLPFNGMVGDLNNHI
jgi:hypothetical protein